MAASWYEIWVDEGLTPPYVLLVLRKDNHAVFVFDPRENAAVYEALNYEEVKLWLLEDEYTLVARRSVGKGTTA